MIRLLTHPATIAATTVSALMAIALLVQVADHTPAQRPNSQNAKREIKTSVDVTDRVEVKEMSHDPHEVAEKIPTLSNEDQTRYRFPG